MATLRAKIASTITPDGTAGRRRQRGLRIGSDASGRRASRFELTWRARALATGRRGARAHLLAEQFREWVDLPLRRIEPSGTVNAIFRLVMNSLRGSRVFEGRRSQERGDRRLPQLAPLLRVALRVPVAQDRPSEDYAWSGDPHLLEANGAVRRSRDRARRLAVLGQSTRPTQQEPHVDAASRWATAIRRSAGWRATAIPPDRLMERALARPGGPPIWHTAPSTCEIGLVRDRISSVIDWAMGVEDAVADGRVEAEFACRSSDRAARRRIPLPGTSTHVLRRRRDPASQPNNPAIPRSWSWLAWWYQSATRRSRGR